MAQAFVTTYRNHYRWNTLERTKSLKPYDPVAEKIPEGDMWLSFEDLSGMQEDQENHTLAEAEKMVKQLYKERYQTIYQIHYCREGENIKKKKATNQVHESELLEYCKNLFDPTDKQRVLPPLPSMRRIFGFLTPSTMYVPLTCYQDDYGKLGYKVLKKNNETPKTDTQKTDEVSDKKQNEKMGSKRKNKEDPSRSHKRQAKPNMVKNNVTCFCCCKRQTC